MSLTSWGLSRFLSWYYWTCIPRGIALSRLISCAALSPWASLGFRLLRKALAFWKASCQSSTLCWYMASKQAFFSPGNCLCIGQFSSTPSLSHGLSSCLFGSCFSFAASCIFFYAASYSSLVQSSLAKRAYQRLWFCCSGVLRWFTWNLTPASCSFFFS